MEPLSAAGGRQFTGLTAIEENLAMLIAADEMARTLVVSDASPTVGVQRSDIAGRDYGAKDAHSFVFQQDGVVCGSCDDGVE